MDRVRFAVGAFTNLSHDHLDYHHTMEAYRDAKALLFDACDVGAFNTDDKNGRVIYEQVPCRRVSFGLKARMRICAHRRSVLKAIT